MVAAAFASAALAPLAAVTLLALLPMLLALLPMLLALLPALPELLPTLLAKRPTTSAKEARHCEFPGASQSKASPLSCSKQQQLSVPHASRATSLRRPSRRSPSRRKGQGMARVPCVFPRQASLGLEALLKALGTEPRRARKDMTPACAP